MNYVYVCIYIHIHACPYKYIMRGRGREEWRLRRLGGPTLFMPSFWSFFRPVLHQRCFAASSCTVFCPFGGGSTLGFGVSGPVYTHHARAWLPGLSMLTAHREGRDLGDAAEAVLHSCLPLGLSETRASKSVVKSRVVALQ